MVSRGKITTINRVESNCIMENKVHKSTIENFYVFWAVFLHFLTQILIVTKLGSVNISYTSSYATYLLISLPNLTSKFFL